MNSCIFELLPIGSIHPKKCAMVLAFLCSLDKYILWGYIIKLDPSFDILTCKVMGPVLPVYTSHACTADLWRPLEKQEPNRCHLGWPQKPGKKSYKAGNLTKLNSQTYQPGVTLLSGMDQVHTETSVISWAKGCQSSIKEWNKPSIPTFLPSSDTSRLVQPHWIILRTRGHPQGTYFEPVHGND